MSPQIKAPPITKYLDPSCASRAVDLANLCRRLFAEWQCFTRPVGNFVKVSRDHNALKCPLLFLEVIQKWLWSFEIPVTLDMLAFLDDLPVTKYSVTCKPRPGSTIFHGAHAKDFKGSEGQDLTPEELLEIYWKLKMYGSSAFIVIAVGQLVPEFRKRKYKGFLLPNGKVVPFDSLNLASFWFCPEELHLIDYYQLPKGINISQPNVVVEGILRFDPINGFHSEHHVMVFNLPEKNAKGNLGKLMVLDPTCAQFGMKGKKGEIFYWGYYEDYATAFPASDIFCEGKVFRDYNSREGIPDKAFHAYIMRFKKAALATMKTDFCGYCGEVERKENAKIRLKKCSKCKKALYCDALCQKLAWKSHKSECKSKAK